MAALTQDSKSKKYRILFWFGGKQYHKSLKTTDEKAASAKKGSIEELLLAMEKGHIAVPEPANFWPFLFSGGKLDAKPSVPDVLTLDRLFARYEEAMPPGTMEANSLDTYRLHKNHLLRIIGGRTAAQSVATTDMQRYINERAKEKHHDKFISPRTIKKEVATLRAVWNWGKLHGLLNGEAPTRGLKYEKEDEQLPFMTWAEIEQRIVRGGSSLSQKEIGDLWDCLFLDTKQTEELLAYVKEHAAHPFIYPMFVFVAHTGARRSEMMRSEVDDLDFQAGEVVLREKKKNRSKKVTFRRVPMTPLLRRVMTEWLANDHPGGKFTFCVGEVMARSKKRSKTTGHQSGPDRAKSLNGRMATVREREQRPGLEPLTKDEAHGYLKRTLAGGKWEVVRGFHVFRHSFASNCAAKGINSDKINEWMGHTTEEMRRHYRHLFPTESQDALRKVFGE